MVKADGYGLGAAAAARVLAALGCERFFVAATDEGRRLRAALPGLGGRSIYVLSGPTDADDAGAQAGLGLIPVVNDARQLDLWRPHRRLPAAVHVDTGMNRLGFAAQRVDPADFTGFNLDLVLSHPACGDTPEHPLNAIQRRRCEEVAALFPGVPASFTSTAGAITGAGPGGDIARLGIGLYGGNPFADRPNPVVPVATFEAPVLALREAAAGDTVGYGGTVLDAPARLATVGAGYADGIPRRLSGRGAVAAGGRRLPIVGRVSMDLVTVDATAAGDLREGDLVEVFGAAIPVDEVATLAGTIGYEILTGVGPRVERRYRAAPTG